MKLRSKLYRASAGTGKTHQLTSHYLRLVCKGARHERIVASTFTRKAAGEILARVLSRLAQAATSEKCAAKLDEELGMQLGRAGYLQRLDELARRIDGFRISTLDAFFVLVAQSLAGELGLPPDWSIADEVDLQRSRDSAVADALASLDRSQWGILLRELERGASARGVHSTLIGTVELAAALHAESDAVAWNGLSLPNAVSDHEIADLPRRIRALPVVQTKNGGKSGSFEKLRSALLELVGRDDFAAWVTSVEGTEALRALLKKGVGKCLIDGATTYYELEIPPEWIAAHEDLFRVLAAGDITRLAAHNRAARRLLDVYSERRLAERERSGKLGFDEIASALAEHATGGAQSLSSELEERLDARIDHLLLDEFQDTAPLQWRVLKRVSEELVQESDGSRTFFCVGDTKQSIYGWRAGEPRLLEQMEHRLRPLEVSDLNLSYRSSQVVLDLVNKVFDTKAGFSGFDAQPGSARALEMFCANYVTHTAKHELSGKVRVHTAALPAEVRDRTRACMDRAVELVEELRKVDARATIAILLRRNRYAAYLLTKLRDRGIAASGEGGNPLVDSIAVQAAVSALHWLEHPGDGVALYHVATSALAPALGLSADGAVMQAASIQREQRRALLRLGVAGWLAELRSAVAEKLGLWEQRRFAQLIDFALAQDSSGSLDEFLARVASVRVEDASSAAVKVMTVHASKGLEFDAVVLPELDQAWKQEGNVFYWRREDDDPEQRIDLVSRSVSSPTLRAFEVAGLREPVELHEMARERGMRDELSVLYVALTRARYSLQLVIHAVGNQKNQVRRTPSALLRERLGLGHGALPERAVVYESDTPESDWVAHLKAPKEAAAGLRAARELTFAPSVRRRELERRSPSDLSHEESISISKFFEGVDDTRAQRRGSRFHRWLEELEWIDNFSRTPDELRALAREVSGADEWLEQDLAEFLASLQKRNFRTHFTKPAGSVEVWRERRFRIARGETLESGSFDRVVVWREGERIVRAEVLDFKTSKPTADLAARREHYRPQLEAYRTAVAEITGLPREKVVASLFFLEADEYMPID
jgi:ATP-dependent helicase/nuclease subunit A